MRIYIVGVACVGKSTIGELLAEKLNYKFVDFDWEVERRMEEHITQIKSRHFNGDGYRDEVKHILEDLLSENKDDIVIAMPPSGLFRQYDDILKSHPDVIIIALKDKAKHILERTTFYDDDSVQIFNVVNDKNRHLYYKDIVEDIEFFGKSYKKADIKYFLNGRNVDDSVEGLLKALEEYREKEIEVTTEKK